MEESKPSSTMLKILVIEDSVIFRELIKEILELEGFEVLIADNGLLGIKLAIQESPDLILSDIIMPGIDGYTVLEKLKSNPKTANIPFVFSTVKMSKEEDNILNKIEANYLTKPFSNQELLNCIDAQLKNARKYAQDRSVDCLNNISV